jgi:hypothetical protein
MARILETLGYGLIACAITGGALYGLMRYAGSAAPAAAPQPVQSATLPHPPPRPYTQPAIPTPPQLPAPPPAVPTDNDVRAGNKIYTLNPATPAQVDQGSFNSLRQNCTSAAAINRNGEYPALQQAACARFADFARQKGWDTGELPAYAARQPQERQQVDYQDEGEPDHSGECAALYQEEQNIEAAMRAGYREPLGNQYRARLQAVEEQLWKLRCPVRQGNIEDFNQ